MAEVLPASSPREVEAEHTYPGDAGTPQHRQSLLPAEAEASPRKPDDAQLPQFAKRRFGWFLEIAAVVMSAVMFAGMVILLIYWDGKPFDEWNSAVSLNSIISVMSIAARLCLAYGISSCLGQGKWDLFERRPGPLSMFSVIDGASRGLNGSLRLIWRSKFRYAGAAACHASSLTARD